ncbi:MAG: DinB family protein [Frankiales bacterium]|nr:DinB family protein [Frankiales bacterium]
MDWVEESQDPRSAFADPEGEWDTLVGYLRHYRLTIEMKCADLTPEQLATRSVPPSTMSLLGMVRHLARVEHNWFVRVLGGQGHLDRIYWSESDDDLDFNAAVGTQACVDDAWSAWRREVAVADAYLDTEHDLAEHVPLPRGGTAPVRDVLVHMIEEYARHAGHVDLLRECLDGRTGQ